MTHPSRTPIKPTNIYIYICTNARNNFYRSHATEEGRNYRWRVQNFHRRKKLLRLGRRSFRADYIIYFASILSHPTLSMKFTNPFFFFFFKITRLIKIYYSIRRDPMSVRFRKQSHAYQSFSISHTRDLIFQFCMVYRHPRMIKKYSTRVLTNLIELDSLGSRKNSCTIMR